MLAGKHALPNSIAVPLPPSSTHPSLHRAVLGRILSWMTRLENICYKGKSLVARHRKDVAHGQPQQMSEILLGGRSHPRSQGTATTTAARFTGKAAVLVVGAACCYHYITDSLPVANAFSLPSSLHPLSGARRRAFSGAKSSGGRHALTSDFAPAATAPLLSSSNVFATTPLHLNNISPTNSRAEASVLSMQSSHGSWDEYFGDASSSGDEERDARRRDRSSGRSARDDNGGTGGNAGGRGRDPEWSGDRRGRDVPNRGGSDGYWDESGGDSRRGSFSRVTIAANLIDCKHSLFGYLRQYLQIYDLLSVERVRKV